MIQGYRPGLLTFAELLKEPEFLHFYLLVPGITNACPAHPFPVLPFLFYSQHYPKLNTHLKRFLVFMPFDVFSPLFPHIPSYFLTKFFMRQCYFKCKSSLPSQGPSGLPGTTACWEEGPSDDPFRVAATACNQQQSIWGGFFSTEVSHRGLTAEELVPQPNLFIFFSLSDMKTKDFLRPW